MPYPSLLVQPFRDELARIGVSELMTAEDVDEFMKEKAGTALLVINSVCGCAAGKARPAIRIALEQGRRPDRMGTVLAGQDIEATAQARSYFADIPPSSPSIAIFKDGELAYFMPRSDIEGRDADAIARDLAAVFNQHCAATGATSLQ
ncbi:MAG: BrxA/BrxB family bacilliredoxin [Acidobacteria bacterium]|nr:BrxA/BrxB family bacilliredoxin [Acidobacteriota bacterium]